jgi:hypothetical protein
MKRTDLKGALPGDPRLAPSDGNAVNGRNSTSKSAASQMAKRTDHTRRGVGAHSAASSRGAVQRPRWAWPAMGEFTVLQKGDGWIVLEDGRRVGGTLRYPFPTREAAERHIERELADESKLRANGDFAKSAKCKVMRETNAELWALFANIEKEFADEDEATREAAHAAAGTLIIMIRFVIADLEADGDIYRTGEMRDGRPVFAPTKSNGSIRNFHEYFGSPGQRLN